MIKKNSFGFLNSESAISLIIGAILLLAIMVAVISIIQVQSVPEWNKAVEVEHSDVVYYDFLKIKSSIENIPVSQFPGSDAVHMGVHYPTNLIFLNPPDTSGTLTLKKDTWINVSYTDSNNIRRSFNNSSTRIIFNPNYNYFTNAPLIVYEHGLVIKEFSNYLFTDADQDIFSNGSLNIPILESPEDSISFSGIKVLNFFPQSNENTTNSNVSVTFYTNYPQLWDVIWNRSNLTSPGLHYIKSGNNTRTVEYPWNITINIHVVNGTIPPVTPIPTATPPVIVTYYIPPVPMNLNSTQGNFWINNTWQPGSGNKTDSFNVSLNGTWINGTTNKYNNITVPPHGWRNMTLWAYNNSGFGRLSLSSISLNTHLANNIPVQPPIGNKNVATGNVLTFTVSATDADSDTITYGTNASKGTLNPLTGVYSWTPASSDVGTYTWYFNSRDNYGGIDTETITVTISNTVTLVANSMGNTGFSARTTGENLYSSTVSNSQVGTRTPLTIANLNALSVDDGSYVTRTGTGSLDAIMVINFTLSNVHSVNWVSLKFVGAVTTNDEPIIIGLYNETSPSGGGWTKLNAATPVKNTYITMTYNISSQADKDKYLELNGSTLMFSFAEWVNGDTSAGLSNDLYQATINYQ